MHLIMLNFSSWNGCMGHKTSKEEKGCSSTGETPTLGFLGKCMLAKTEKQLDMETPTVQQSKSPTTISDEWHPHLFGFLSAGCSFFGLGEGSARMAEWALV